MPWFLLALLFYIPGVYMEFPADPWQHYARTNEWVWLQTVTEHSFWTKSSYFLAYSLIGHISPPVVQLKWFDVYYTGCCLLLCWQYYKLARTIGLGPRTSFTFVLLQALIFGNFIFGFYRYYGMSSTLFSQLGAVAMIRIAIETAQNPQLSLRSFFRPLSPAPCPPSSSPDALRRDEPAIVVAAAGRLPPSAFHLPPFASSLSLSAALLTLLIAFNHGQGLGIAALGLAAVGIWRLAKWRAPALAWLGGIVVLLNLAVFLWYPRDPLLHDLYRPAGWLTPWYGFNLFWPTPDPMGSYGRSMAIIGWFGLLNLCAGLLLLRRNHIVAWLTLLPPLALSLPLVAIPLSTLILRHNPTDGLITFSRPLLGIPAALALVTLCTRWWPALSAARAGRAETRFHAFFSPSSFFRSNRPFALFSFSLFALMVVPNTGMSYN
ncbi:MAG: hypothetical protein ABUL61_04050, partial [Oleiharenicola lentus]